METSTSIPGRNGVEIFKERSMKVSLAKAALANCLADRLPWLRGLDEHIVDELGPQTSTYISKSASRFSHHMHDRLGGGVPCGPIQRIHPLDQGVNALMEHEKFVSRHRSMYIYHSAVGSSKGRVKPPLDDNVQLNDKEGL